MNELSAAQLTTAFQEQQAMNASLQAQLQQMQQHLHNQQQQTVSHSSSSSPSPGVGTFAVHKGKEPAPVKPDTFDGHPKSNPDRWLKDMKRYLQVSDISVSRWVQHSAAYLRESASTWMDEIESLDPNLQMGWDSFSQLFISRFRPLEASRTARVVLKSIKQRMSVDDYNNRFRDQIKYCTDMAMEDQLSLYFAGLKPEIESELYRVDPSTLEEAMILAVRMDMRLFARNRERSASSNGRFNNQHQHQRQQYQRPAGGNSGSAPMELGAVTDQQNGNEGADNGNETGELNAMPPGRFAKGPTPNLSSEEFQRCRSAGICFKCKKTGHIARSCPSNPPKKY